MLLSSIYFQYSIQYVSLHKLTKKSSVENNFRRAPFPLTQTDDKNYFIQQAFFFLQKEARGYYLPLWSL
jgi:hypothetical protein